MYNVDGVLLQHSMADTIYLHVWPNGALKALEKLYNFFFSWAPVSRGPSSYVSFEKAPAAQKHFVMSMRLLLMTNHIITKLV